MDPRGLELPMDKEVPGQTLLFFLHQRSHCTHCTSLFRLVALTLVLSQYSHYTLRPSVKCVLSGSAHNRCAGHKCVKTGELGLYRLHHRLAPLRCNFDIQNGGSSRFRKWQYDCRCAVWLFAFQSHCRRYLAVQICFVMTC